MLGVVVPLQLPLDAADGVGASPREILLCVVQFILIQIKLSLRHVKLLLRAVLMSGAGGGELFLQLIDVILIGFKIELSLSHVRKKFASFGRGRSWVVGGIAKRVLERDINFVIGQTQG